MCQKCRYYIILNCKSKYKVYEYFFEKYITLLKFAQTNSIFRSVIDGEPLRFRGEVYHPYHFNCNGCNKELTSSAVEVKTRPGYTANELNELYCLRCHFKMGIPICGACRRPIEGRVVTALGQYLFQIMHPTTQLGTETERERKFYFFYKQYILSGKNCGIFLIEIPYSVFRKTLVCGTFRLCQMRKTFSRKSAL